MQAPDFESIRRMAEEREEAFSRFVRLLNGYNEKFNLTAITDPDDVKIKHIYDSLAGEFLLPAGANVAEVGSGAGFPSIPLMIARPDLTFTLIESTGKKCAFLRAAAEELGLNARVLCMRAEDAARRGEYREKFDFAVARAVARLDTLAEYCLPLVRVGGTAIAYKGSESETDCARGAVRTLGGGRMEEVRYALPCGKGERTLVIMEKERKTPARYPRGNGKERSDPLK